MCVSGRQTVHTVSAFDNGALDILPSVCNKIVLLLYLIFSYPTFLPYFINNALQAFCTSVNNLNLKLEIGLKASMTTSAL